jgi:hypothetical protein
LYSPTVLITPHLTLFFILFFFFHIIILKKTGKNNTLPANLKPSFHCNYENRGMDYHDELPKFAAFPPENMVNNDGTPVAK